MAHNRMWLVHDLTAQRVLLAKHSVGPWKSQDDGSLTSRLDAAFIAEACGDDVDGNCRSGTGGTGWRVEYEYTDAE